MVSLSALWLPIVIAAVIVFVASSIIHMVLPYHRTDYKAIPDEDRTLAGLRSAGLKRGLYVFPFCAPKDMKTPAMQERYKQGPVGFAIIYPNGVPVLPKFLVQWFVYCLLISFFVAYLSAHTIPAGLNYLAVFRVVGTAAFLAFGLGNIPNGVWRGWPWSNVMKEVVDGLIYALLVAGTFGWLWPR